MVEEYLPLVKTVVGRLAMSLPPHVDIEDLYKAIGALKAGRLNLEELTQMSCVAVKGPGVCAGLATANTSEIRSPSVSTAWAR